MTVGKCPGLGEDARITLSTDDEANWLVNFNAFLPWVGKYRYGRVVLDNGLSAAFELKCPLAIAQASVDPKQIFLSALTCVQATR